MEHLFQKIYRKDFVETFPGDHSGDVHPRQTPGVLYSKAIPSPVAHPQLLAWSQDLATLLGIDQPDEQDVQILGGNLVAPTMFPYAACYAGHQFGNWAGQLGDGRAITLGEWQTKDQGLWELQLKGAGPTPYSRRADGRAVLRSSLREYLMSEAMHNLRVPTTRALSLVSTGEQVMRDMFYDGHPAYEPGAIVMRAAPTFIRFGNFEILAARQEKELLQKLVDWTIEKYYPHIQGENKIITWFKEVMERTALLIVEWLRVGFVHGVMNTDNMSILGLTIDYGPFSFVDAFDPDFTPNTTDLPGRRYAFGKQSAVAFWNLECLGGAIAPLFENSDALVSVLEEYETVFLNLYYDMMKNKIGLDQVRPEDPELFGKFQEVLSTIGPDMTIFYQQLMELPLSDNTEESIIAHFRPSFYHGLSQPEASAIFQLVQAYTTRLKANAISREQSQNLMRENNPRFILRNYLLHQAIEQLEKGDDTLFVKLQDAIKHPYSHRADEFFAIRPEWANQKAGCSMLSCSS